MGWGFEVGNDQGKGFGVPTVRLGLWWVRPGSPLSLSQLPGMGGAWVTEEETVSCFLG